MLRLWLTLLLTSALSAGSFDLGTVAATLTVGLTVTVAVGVLVVVLRPVEVDATPVYARCTGLRARAKLSEFLRLRDPDAAGRPRPRAPGARPAIAG